MENAYGWGLPVNVSAHGAPIDKLIIVLHIFMITLFIGWLIFLIFTLIKFRARPGHKANYKVNHFKAPTYLEVGIALFEVFLLLAFSIPVVKHLRYTFPDEKDALQVRIVSEQFAWNVHYAGLDNKFGRTDPSLIGSGNQIGLDEDDPASEDDIILTNQLHIPVNKPVVAHLTSKDVIHSFSLPVMRVKQDAIPGTSIPVWMEANQTGKFQIACAQLCGLGHYRMKGTFQIREQEDFDKWLKKKVDKKLDKAAKKKKKLEEKARKAREAAELAAAEKLEETESFAEQVISETLTTEEIVNAAEDMVEEAEELVEEVEEEAAEILNTTNH